MGDSRTNVAGWQDPLVAGLRAAGGSDAWYNNQGVGAATVASTVGNLAAILAAANPPPPVMNVLVNLGVNDMPAMPAEATWEADYLTIIDAVHAKWPTATVYLSKPWGAGYDAEADTLAGRIDTILAARAFTAVGDDERVWAKPNVATMYTDWAHYSYPLGMATKAAEVQTAMGF